MKISEKILFAFVCLGLPVVSANAVELIYATDGVANTIRVYDKVGTEMPSISNPALDFPTLLEGFNGGQYFITDINFAPWGGSDLVKMDLRGNVVSRTTTQDIFGATGGGIVDVINSGSDTFFVTSTLNAQIAEIDSDLNLIRRFSSGATSSGLRTLGGAVSNDGAKLYVADADGQSGTGLIRIYDTLTGSQIDTLSNPAIEFPFMLEFNAVGDLFLTDRGGSFTEDKILSFSATGVLQDQFTSGAPIHYNFGAFDLDSKGNLVLLETNFDTDSPIRILSNDGGFIAEFGDGLSNPNGILVMSTVPLPAALWLFVTGAAILIGIGTIGDRPRK